jgi:hypothetical protein
MQKPRFMIILFAFALFLQTATVFAKTISEAGAVNILMRRIDKSQVYAPWLKPACSSVFTEAKTAKYYEFAIHENHTKNCAGDTNTSPIIDRIRVSRINNSILWYDVVSAQYLPFKALIEYRNRKRESNG